MFLLMIQHEQIRTFLLSILQHLLPAGKGTSHYWEQLLQVMTGTFSAGPLPWYRLVF